MKTTIWTTIFLVCFQSGAAFGQDVPAPTEAARSLTEVEQERDSVKLAGPRVGIALSTMGIVSGGMVVLMGVGAGLANSQSDPADGKPYYIAGAVVLVAGVAGLAVSIVKLKRGKQKRRELQKEMEQLRLNGVVTSAPPPQRPAMLRF